MAALLIAVGMLVGQSPEVHAASPSPQQTVARRACDAITGRVGGSTGASLLLVSYESGGKPVEPPLQTAAFTYDNALAVIALIACDRLPQARRVGEALRLAAMRDPRLKNAYRAGSAKDNGPLPNGWWDASANRWQEDAYQAGTSTGNVAWATLAMLALHEATGESRWRDAAVRLGQWIVAHARDETGVPGFAGGLDGFDPDPARLAWKSTEHNIDAVALFTWLDRGSAAGEWKQAARNALRFVAAQWDAKAGYFRIGALPDGTENLDASALDVQMWAQLLPGAPPDWRRAVRYAETHYYVTGGFDFNGDRDGLWLEGTAQAALAYEVLGENAGAAPLFATIAGQFAPGGYLYATREAHITTGLAIGAGSTSVDFHYFHQPHLGATAWAALAAQDWNPFVPHPRTASGKGVR